MCKIPANQEVERSSVRVAPTSFAAKKSTDVAATDKQGEVAADIGSTGGFLIAVQASCEPRGGKTLSPCGPSFAAKMSTNADATDKQGEVSDIGSTSEFDR